MSKWIGMTIAPAVTGRFRSLEGRPLGMSSSVMLPESARLGLSELGSSFVTALAEQRQPMTGLLIPQPGQRWWEALQEFEGAVRPVPRDHDAAKMLHHVRARLNWLRPRERGATCKRLESSSRHRCCDEFIGATSFGKPSASGALQRELYREDGDEG